MGTSTTQTISAFNARRKFGDILIGTLQGKDYIVERNGKPIAAVVSIERYEKMEKNREEFFDMMEQTAQQTILSEQETQKIVGKAVKATRTQR